MSPSLFLSGQGGLGLSGAPGHLGLLPGLGAPGAFGLDGLPGAPGHLGLLPGLGAPGAFGLDGLSGAPGHLGLLPGLGAPGQLGLEGGLGGFTQSYLLGLGLYLLLGRYLGQTGPEHPQSSFHERSLCG